MIRSIPAGRQIARVEFPSQNRAREQFAQPEKNSFADLLLKLEARDWRVRWNACKALGKLGDRRAAAPLVGMLLDDDTSVRWAAMGSLIQLGRVAIPPLMLALTRDFSSARLRQGAHHVLHALYNQSLLTEAEEQVFRALEGPTTGIQAAGLANKILIGQ